MPLTILNPQSFKGHVLDQFEDVAKKYFPRWNPDGDWTIGCHGDRPHKPQRNFLCYMLAPDRYFYFDPETEGSCRPELKFILFNERALAKYHNPKLRLLFIHVLCHSYGSDEEEHDKRWRDEMSNRCTLAEKLGEKTLSDLIDLERLNYLARVKGHQKERERTKAILEQCDLIEEGQPVPGKKEKPRMKRTDR